MNAPEGGGGMRNTCGRFMDKPNASFKPEEICPSLNVTQKMIEKGIQHLLKKVINDYDVTASGIVKASLPYDFAQAFDGSRIDGSIAIETETTSVTSLGNGIFELKVEHEIPLIERRADLVLSDMNVKNMAKINYFSIVYGRGSLTQTLVADASIPENWNFNQIDDILPQSSSITFEAAGAMRAFSPEVCNLPVCYLNISPHGRKMWYTIAETDKFKIIEYLKHKGIAKCNTPLNHGRYTVSIELLKKLGITVHRAMQRFGDLMVVRPGTFFQTLALNEVVSEVVSFYSKGYEECAIRNLVCKCPDRPKMSDDKVYMASLLVGSLLLKAHDALYGAPEETYRVILRVEENEEDDSHINVPVATAPDLQPSITDLVRRIDRDVKKGKHRRGKTIPRVGVPVKRRAPANYDPNKKFKNNKNAWLFRPLAPPCAPDCGCGACALKQLRAMVAERDANNNNDGVDATTRDARIEDEAEEGCVDVNHVDENDIDENGVDTNDKTVDASVDNRNGALIVHDGGGDASTVVQEEEYIIMTHPELVRHKINDRLIHFEKYQANKTAEQKRIEESKRKSKKVHSDPRGLVTWLTNHISLDKQAIEALENKRQQFNEDIDEEKLEFLKSKRSHLVEMRDAYRILKQLFCLQPDALKSLIASGYSVMGIFRDFINGTSDEHRETYHSAVKNAFRSLFKDHAPEWHALGECKRLWFKKFGVDKRYRIPWKDWARDKSIKEASITLPSDFNTISQLDKPFLSEPCLCETCATHVDCDCDACQSTQRIRALCASNDENDEMDEEGSEEESEGVDQHARDDESRKAGNPLVILSGKTTSLNFSYDKTGLPRFILNIIDEVQLIQEDEEFKFTPVGNVAVDETYSGIRQSDLDQLKDGVNLGRHIVDAYINLIIDKAKDSQAIILDALFFERASITEPEINVICDAIQSAKWLLVPIFDNANWKVFVFNVNTKEYFVYNPSDSNKVSSATQRKIDNFIEKLASSYLRLEISSQLSTHQIAMPSLPLQHNPSDSGVFILQVIRQINAGIEEIQVFVPFSRELILAELLQNNLIDLY